jgi:hypothetical protein
MLAVALAATELTRVVSNVVKEFQVCLEITFVFGCMWAPVDRALMYCTGADIMDFPHVCLETTFVFGRVWAPVDLAGMGGAGADIVDLP